MKQLEIIFFDLGSDIVIVSSMNGQGKIVYSIADLIQIPTPPSKFIPLPATNYWIVN